MRAPDFWGRDGGILGPVLAPLGWGYGLATRFRFVLARSWKPHVPVVCVGNVVAGGAGKTPVALSLGERLIKQGRNVHFLSRGFGGSATGPLRVDPKVHTAEDVGDEALLLAARAPTWVSADRRAAARLAAAADVIIMDDGFQDPSVAKDLSLVVVDGRYGFGNGRTIPAGPLREPAAAALGRADALVVMGADEAGIGNHPSVRGKNIPLLRAGVKPGPEVGALKGKPVAAFAGIANPEKFFATLEEAGCVLRSTRAFSDHHPYTPGEIQRLKSEAEEMKAVLVTTAKDAMRLSAPDLSGIEVLTISVRWTDEASLDAVLRPLFGD
jgi:tetraacyldisaccharide 4'-kinase